MSSQWCIFSLTFDLSLGVSDSAFNDSEKSTTMDAEVWMGGSSGEDDSQEENDIVVADDDTINQVWDLSVVMALAILFSKVTEQQSTHALSYICG